MAKIRRVITSIKWITIFTVVTIGVALTSAPFYVYQTFTTETPIAKLEFIPVSEHVFDVTLFTHENCSTQGFRIYGEQAQLDASFLKWQDWVMVLGAQSLYRFERLSGRFADLDTAPDNRQHSVQLRPNVVLDPFFEGKIDGRSNWLVATQFGSSVFFDIDALKVYTIFKTEDALIVKSRPRVLLNEDGLAIDISTACLQQQQSSSFGWSQIATGINRFLVTLLD